MARQTLVLLPGLLNLRRLFERQIADLADIADRDRCPTCGITKVDWGDGSGDPRCRARALRTRWLLPMGGYVCFEILRRAAERVERLALIDTQAVADTPEASARRRGFIEQSKLGRFHGVQPSLLPAIVHRNRLDSPAVVQPILDMAAEVGADGFRREQTAMIARPDSRPHCWSRSTCLPW